MKGAAGVIPRGRQSFARRDLEQLATQCLHPCMTALSLVKGGDPSNIDMAEAGALSVKVAVAIRKEAARQIEEILATEDAGQYLTQLAFDLAKEQGQGGAS